MVVQKHQELGRRSQNVRHFDPCKHPSRGTGREIRARISIELEYVMTQTIFEQDRTVHTDDRPPTNLSFRSIIIPTHRTLADFGHSHNDMIWRKERLRRDNICIKSRPLRSVVPRISNSSGSPIKVIVRLLSRATPSLRK